MMKYLQGRKQFDIRIMEQEIPVPGHNHVLVKVFACGICGTDLHFLKENEKYTPLGHEISAMVVALGDSVTGVRIGDMVVVEDLAPCGICPECRNGNSGMCRNMTGLEGQSGMGEYLCVHENNLVPCEGLTPEQASMVEPSAVALTACLAGNIREGETAVVWGLGPIALLCVPLLKYYHAGKVFCIGGSRGTRRNISREQAARDLGADAVYYSGDDKIEEKLPDDVRTVIVTSPPGSLPEAVKTAGYGSTVVVLGVNLGREQKAPVDVDDMVFGKKRLIPVLTEPAMYFPKCMDLIRLGVLPVERLITHKLRLTDIGLIRELYGKDRGVIKGILVNEPNH